MDDKTLAEISDWFRNYVNGFGSDDEDQKRNINIKISHTYRVNEEILSLSRRMGLSSSESNLASAIAILHDVGRFEQYLRYNTFSDIRSEDHAELGIKIIREHQVLKNTDSGTEGIILCSVRYHNRPFLPAGESENCLFHARLIRDADKLDIWRVVTEYYHDRNGGKNAALVLELRETPGISKEVYNALMNRRIVDMRYVNNVNDIKLLQAGWIYDLNFGPTFETVRERRYIEKLRQVLPDSAEIEDIFSEIRSALSER